MSVRRRSGDLTSRNRATRSWTILDYDRLAQTLA